MALRTITASDQSTIENIPQSIGEAFTYTIEWGVIAETLGTTVSSVAWTVDSGDAAISGEALSSNDASALITTATTSTALIKVVATMTDGQIDTQYFRVKVYDPKGKTTNDYCGC